jgi:hypothetical protein
VVQSTDAALDYLQRLKNQFGSWELGEAGLGFNLLLLYHFDLLVCAALLEGHGLGGNGL